jgi:hypothetical protein
MTASRVIVLGLVLLAALAAAPVAEAHIDLNVTVCDPLEGFCRCVHVGTVQSERHLHTFCLA